MLLRHRESRARPSPESAKRRPVKQSPPTKPRVPSRLSSSQRSTGLSAARVSLWNFLHYARGPNLRPVSRPIATYRSRLPQARSLCLGLGFLFFPLLCELCVLCDLCVSFFSAFPFLSTLSSHLFHLFPNPHSLVRRPARIPSHRHHYRHRAHRNLFRRQR